LSIKKEASAKTLTSLSIKSPGDPCGLFLGFKLSLRPTALTIYSSQRYGPLLQLLFVVLAGVETTFSTESLLQYGHFSDLAL
jgi:hypothetical protein